MRTSTKDYLKAYKDAEIEEVEVKRKYLLDPSNKSNRDEYYKRRLERAEAEIVFFREVLVYE